MSGRCWLCLYNQTNDARLFHTFIVENVGSMSPDTMAGEISRKLTALHPDENGTSVEVCLGHIKQHTLTPVVRLSMMLRSLLKISDNMSVTLDGMGDDVGSDLKLIDAYLKVQTQILLLYKNPDTNKMLFADKST
jgi:hypothetical protein